MSLPTFRHHVERVVAGPVGQVRTALLRAVTDDGFTVDVERTTLVEAGRGSTMSGALSVARLPVRLAVRLAETDGGTRVEVSAWDRWPAAAQVRGLDAMYADLFGRLTALVDEALGPFGRTSAQPAGSASGPAPGAAPGTAPAALVDRYAGSAAAAARTAIAGADRRLTGARDDWPQRWARVVGLDVRLPDEAPQRLGRDDVDGLLDVATLLGRQPGDLPPPLVTHAERLAAAVETALDSGLPVPVLALTADDAPALLFLRQQAALREVLPPRRLLVCRDCRLEKVVNDEYQRIAERQRRLSELVSRVTVVAPAGMLRQALRLGRMQPDFVCPRCQGLRADTYVVTFCPACGAQQRDGALRACGGCGHDFRAQAVALLAARPPVPVEPQHPAAPVSGPVPVAPPTGAAAAGAAPSGPAPGPPGPVAHHHVRPPAPGRPAATPLPAAGWYPDPWRASPLRWWDGRSWTGWTHAPQRSR